MTVVLVDAPPGVPGPRLRVPSVPGGARLERRLFEPGVQRLPLLYLALRARRPDAAVAYGLVAAAAAVAAGTRTVFVCDAVPDRAWLTARRGRLALMARALEAEAVVATSQAGRDAFARWLGVTAHTGDPLPLLGVH